jgi:hypothetical protein
MAYPQTYIPPTKHSVFYSHSIHVNGIEIGSFERFSMRSSRTVDRIREILASRGPQVKDMVWGGTDISIDLSKVELYNQAMFEAFGFAIYTLEDFNQFVNITESQWNAGKNPTSDTPNRVITFVDCVASDWSKDLDVGTAKVVESMTFQVRTIVGTRA